MKKLYIKQTEEQKVFMSSDFHIGHKNICEGTSNWADKSQTRPFKTVEEMNETLISNINSTVGENDIFFILGDFAFAKPEIIKEIRNRIICKNIHFIFGNHDKEIRRNKEIQNMFLSCQDYLEVNVDGILITLCHYAFKVWRDSHHGSMMLYGHSHGTLPDDKNSLSMDVGVDTNNYFPYSFDEIKKIMSKKEFKPVDHHDKNTN